MAITSLDGYIAAAKQIISYTKTSAQTTVAANWSTLFDRAGNPGAGTLAGSNTANGLVPNDATAGCPTINFSTNRGYVSNIDFGSSVACRLALVDMLFKAGAYSFNSNVALTAQPSYASRVSYNGGAADYNNTQLWVEVVTTMTGILTLTITYTNQAGTAGRTVTGFVLPTGAIAGRLFQVPLAAGDSGVQKIESVVASVATVGTFNLLVLRPLWSGRVRAVNDGATHGLDLTGMPEIFGDSALVLLCAPDSTSSGAPDVQIEIANG